MTTDERMEMLAKIIDNGNVADFLGDLLEQGLMKEYEFFKEVFEAYYGKKIVLVKLPEGIATKPS